MNKKLLIISRHAPYGSSLAREALDVALAASIYDQEVGILFMDDGVFQLLDNQNSDDILQKKITSTISALPLYGVDMLYVHKESLEERNLNTNDLLLDNSTIINTKDVHHLLSQQDHLLSF